MRQGQVLEGATAFEVAQLKATWCIHGQSLFTKIASQGIQFVRHPWKFLTGLTYALALQKGRLKEMLWAVFHFMEAAMLAREMRKRKINHVHVHFAGSEAAIALYAHRAFGISYSLTLHGPDVFYNVALGHLAEKLDRAAFVICISHFATGQAMRLIGTHLQDKLFLVHCGVDPNRYKPPQKTNSDTNPFQLVCTGRLTATKGQALLVQACGVLRERGLNFRCTFIGDGDQRKELEAMAAAEKLQDCVSFTGALPQDGVLAQLEQADCFVLPTFAEGVPVVLMEAMSMEIPCVTTRVGGIAELIEDGVNGWLVHSGDYEGLTDRLEQLMRQPELLAPTGKKARETVQNEFNVEKSGQLLATVFQRQLDKPE